MARATKVTIKTHHKLAKAGKKHPAMVKKHSGGHKGGRKKK